MAKPGCEESAAFDTDPHDPALLELKALLARAAKVHARPEGIRLFELAVSAQPTCAVAWLWLAAVTNRDATADARMRIALDLDLGNAAWREACGELLIAIALRRTRQRPESARAILIDAQYVKPRDGRVWVALALTASMPASRLAYLERAVELDGIDADRVRAEIALAAVDVAMEYVRMGRAAAASEALMRGLASPNNQDVRAMASRLGILEAKGRATAAVAPAPGRGPREPWWMRAPMEPRLGSATWLDALEDLAAVKRSLAGPATLLRQFASDAMIAALLQSAADLTASADTAYRRRGTTDRGSMPP